MGVSHTTPRRLAVVAAAVAATISLGMVPLAAAAPASAVNLPAALDASDAKPENVVLTPAEDASVAQAFTWRTGSAVQDGQVHLREVGGSDWRIAEATVNQELVSAGVSTRTHSATVEGLTPNTTYEYFVGNETAVSSTYTFTTAGAAGEDFSFIYFGDAQNNLTERWAPVVKSAFERFPDAVGTVNAGDLVNTGGNDSEWTEWFGAMNGYSQTRNVIAAPGNHEYGGDEFLTAWKSNFEYPTDGPQADAAPGLTDGEKQKAAYEAQMQKALAETAYYTDYQGVRFISLNASREQAVALMTPDDLPPCSIACPNPTQLWLDMQADWLDSILTDNPNKWAVAVFHQPVFSTAEGRDETDIRATWLPVFQRNDIDLVLMGHDHTYSRGFVNSDATDTPGMTTGPVYTVAVSGPKYYEMAPADDNVWTQNGATQVVTAGHTSTFQGIHVSKDQIHYESIIGAKWDDESTTDKAVGDTLDSFTITKYDNGEKYVTEDGMPIPEQSDKPAEPGVPAEPEVPAEQPADVPLGHEVVDTFDAPTAAVPGPTAVNPSTGVIYVADTSEEGAGTIEAIDPVTGEVIDSFDVGKSIQDIAFDASFNGVLVALDGDKIASYLTNPGQFGEQYIPAIPAGKPVVSLQYDGFKALVFVGFADGTIVTLNEDFEPAGVIDTDGPLASIRLDDVTGVLYATFANEEDGEVGLRLYETRNENNVLKEFMLDRAAGPLDIDMVKGLAYVGHTSDEEGAGGLSVIDLINEKVLRYDGAEFGGPLGGVGVDAKNGLAYLASSTRTPAPIVVVARQQAPSVVSSPVAQRADAGASVVFTATGSGVPAPSVSWESRAAGADSWVPVESAGASALRPTSETLNVVAGDELDGTQYRAVFTNVIGGEEYATRSASATLRVNAADEPGEENPGEETPGGETPGGETPGGETPGGDAPDDETPGGQTPGDETPGGDSDTDSDGQDPDAAGQSDDDLATTGAEPLAFVVIALLLLVAGGIAIAIRRRLATQK